MSLADITPSPRNAQTIDEASLQDLADSIREHGVIEPIVVRVAVCLKSDCMLRASRHRNEIIAGERRWRAAKLADLETIWARVMYDIDNATALKLVTH